MTTCESVGDPVAFRVVRVSRMTADLPARLHDLLSGVPDVDADAVTTFAARIVQQADLTPDRRAHSVAVGDRVARMVRDVARPGSWKVLARTIGTLHDIGYAHPDTGMHAVDGARWLAREGYPEEVCSQVAYHSTARFEVAARGMDPQLLADFGMPDPLLHAIIWVADFTTSPEGRQITLSDRLSDIRSRYDANSPVVAALDASCDELERSVALLSCEGVQVSYK